MGGVSVGSFKVKLVVYFLLLSLLPLAAAFWGFTAVAGQNETRKVDTRIQTGMRSVLASYQERMRQAQSDARAVAKTSAVQNALRAGDLQPLSHLFRDNGDVSISTPDGELIGRVPQLSASRHVTIKTRSGVLGYVTVSVPFDTSLVDRLRRHSGLQSEDTLAIVAGGEIVASSPTVDGALQSPTGQPRKVTVGGTKYRALVEPALSDDPGMQFAVLRPQSLIDAANDSSRNRTLLSLAEAAHGIARGRLHERVPVRGRDEFALLGSAFNEMANQLEARLAELDEERGRLRDAITRFGEALSATHDTDQLLRVIVEAAVEATGAAGAELLADDGRFVDSGDPDADGVRLEFPLTAGRSAFGTLTIVGDSFDAEQRMAASSLASHATIALENARL